ncbi:hypothetical protein [Micromonospora sp. WMMD1082]|uniref:hypothetical protein n=1 Tax=Micromonospora sp. WMMD1082 TaxID=3016104 RepID=UPI002415A3BD|nr:hypothetical protein [Micromonospora sp. WMMD1082]MDG4792671.1 hypothetical protein [Micromonospora sp. WMMD1082]
MQPNDRYQQGSERTWGAHLTAGQFPAQPPHRGRRARVGALSWSELDRLPAGASARNHLNTH